MCGETLVAQEEIPALGHTSAEAVRENEVAATCTKDGSYDEVVYCSVCGEEISRETKNVEAAGHSFGEWQEIKAATETEVGEKERICSVCGYKETAEIPVLGHTHVYGTDWQSDAENHWYECACGEKSDAAAHTMKWVVDEEATETEKGSKHEECTVCGYKAEAVEIPATGQTSDESGTDVSTESEASSDEKSDAPQTGDNSQIILWIALFVLSGASITGTVVLNRRKGKHCR